MEKKTERLTKNEIGVTKEVTHRRSSSKQGDIAQTEYYELKQNDEKKTIDNIIEKFIENSLQGVCQPSCNTQSNNTENTKAQRPGQSVYTQDESDNNIDNKSKIVDSKLLNSIIAQESVTSLEESSRTDDKDFKTKPVNCSTKTLDSLGSVIDRDSTINETTDQHTFTTQQNISIENHTLPEKHISNESEGCIHTHKFSTNEIKTDWQVYDDEPYDFFNSTSEDDDYFRFKEEDIKTEEEFLDHCVVNDCTVPETCITPRISHYLKSEIASDYSNDEDSKFGIVTDDVDIMTGEESGGVSEEGEETEKSVGEDERGEKHKSEHDSDEQSDEDYVPEDDHNEILSEDGKMLSYLVTWFYVQYILIVIHFKSSPKTL